MITKPSAEELLKKLDNRYEVVISVSRRARQIIDGDNPRVKTDEKSDVTVASLELAKDKYFVTK